MANTLTNLIPTIYQASDTVARELVGFIPAVTRNSAAERAAVGETILYPVVGAMTSTSIAAAATGPDPSAVSVGNETMTLANAESVTFFWEGEEQKGLSNAGYYAQILQDQFTQAFRVLTNKIEADLAGLYASSSRAYGTAGTASFPTANDYTQASNILKILKDNGVPAGDLNLIINTASAANLRGKQALVADQNAGSMLRQGVLLDINGFAVRESAAIKTHTKGTGTLYVIDGTGNLTAGNTLLKAKTGSNTIVAGDVLAIQSDTENYVVKTGLAAPGTFTIANPGLRQTTVDSKTITIGNNYAAQLAFHKSAIHLLTRLPAMPQGGDSADDVLEITDPHSGLSFQICLYRQRRRVAFEVGIAWGVKAVKPEFIATLMG